MRSLNTVSRHLQTQVHVAPAGRRWALLLTCATLAASAFAPAARAQLLYWDANGATTGAGATPTGGWDSSLFWSTDPAGETGTAAWAPGSTAVFSAGSDAVGPFLVTLDAAQVAAGLTFEEGSVTLAGLAPDTNLTWNGSVTVASGASAALNVPMAGTAGLTKSGPGALTLGGFNLFSGNVVVNQGSLAVSTNNDRAFGAAITTPVADAITLNDSTLRYTPTGTGTQIFEPNTNRGIVLGGAGGTIDVQGIGSIMLVGAPISGGALTKTGPGDLRVFTAINTYSKLIINEGTFSAGQSTFAGTDRTYGAVPETYLADAILIQNGATNRTIGGVFVTNSATRGITLGVGGGVFRNDLQPLINFAPIVGVGGLRKEGNRNWTNNAPISYEGNTIINGGTAASFANVVLNGLGTASGTLTLNAGRLFLNHANAFSGTTIVTGRIDANTNGCLGTGPITFSPTNGIIFVNATTLSPTNVILNNDMIVNAGTTLAGAPVIVDIAANAGRELILNGKISGDAHWKKDNGGGTGAIVLANANNDFTGTVTNIAGTVIAAANNALGSPDGGTVINNNVSLAFRGGINYSAPEPVTITGMGRLGFGALSNDSGNCSFAGPVTMAGNSGVGGAAGTTLTLNGIIGESGGPFALSKLTAGTVRLTADNAYSGGTLISNGVLVVANSTGSATGPGPVTIFPGGALSGPGSVAGAVTVNGTISPGSSPGTQNTGSETWNGGGTYVWEINDVDAGQGTDPGWDLINITGSLTINATPANKFNLDIRSLDLASAAGNVADFDNSTEYTWTILKTTTGITGFDAAAFNVVSSGFSNPLGSGLFLVETANGGNDLVIRFVRAPAIAAQPANQTAECATGSASFTVGATGTAPLTYQWRQNGTDIGGATSATLGISPTTAATAGSYEVVVANAFGSVTSAVASLTLVDTVPPVITSCAPAETLSANASCQAAIPDLTGGVVAGDTCSPVTRSQVPAPGTLVGLGAHTVTITILDAANNPATCQATVTVNDTTPPVITACANNQTNVATLASCQAAIPDLTGQVATTDNCAGLVTVTQSPLAGALVGVGNHVVTLTATDAANNTATCQATVTVVSDVTVTVNSPTICPGGSTMLTATTAAANPSYLWSPGGATTASISVSPAETTIYTVTVTDGNTSCTGSGSGTVTVGAALVVTVNSAAICTGGSVQLTATTDATSPSYLWSPGGATTASILVSPTETTAYAVTVTDGSGCTGSGSGTVTVNPLPPVSVNSATVCAGVSATLTATTAAANPSYLWSPGGATTASIEVSPIETTVYTVTVTDGTTTCANTGSGTVTVTPLPTVAVNSETICAGSSATLTATTSASNPTYLWSPGGATTVSIMVSPVETTVYTVTVTDGTTTCANSASGTVTVNPAPTVTVNSPTICVGDSAILAATTSAANPTYLWSPGGETTASITVSPTTTTAYTVTVTDGTTTCSASGSGTVVVKQPVTFANNNAITINDNSTASPYPSTINVSGQTATVCRVTVTLNNLSHDFPDDIDLVLVGPNGRGVLLMSDVGGGSPISGATLTFDDSAASSLPDAGQIVSGTFKPSNIGSKADNRPDNFPVPAPVIQFQTNFALFSGIDPNGAWSLYILDDEPVDFGAIAGGWSIAITTVTPFADVAVAQASIPNPVAVGSNLTFTITVNNNGPANAADVAVTDALPAGVTFITAASSQGSCTPGVGTVSCSLGTILAGGSATVTVVVAPSANATIANLVTVTSSTFDFTTANNTSSISTIVLDPPVITLQPLAQTVCADQGVSLVVTATGSAPLSYQWYRNDVAISGATAATLSIGSAQPGDSGTYTVVVANSVGAVGSVPALVTVNPLPTVAVNSETICLGASAILSATTSAANPSYLWSPGGAITPSITVSPASTTIYTVLVTDGVTGCTNSGSGTVTVTPLTAATPIQSYTNVCPGSPVTFSTVASGTPPFTYEWRKDGVAIAGQATDTLLLPSVVLGDAGTYSVVVTGTCGIVTNSGTLTVVTPPTITAQPQNQTTPMGNGAVFVVAASSVVASNIQWQLNGVDIPGANGTSLAVSNVTLSQTGESYRAVVSNCGGSTTSLAATLTVTPIAGVTFNFDAPGQFTNAPYALSFNDWLSSSFNTPPTVFASTIGGTGPAPGSGALDLLPNTGTGQATVNSSLLIPLAYDFSRPGKALVASTMVKIKSPTRNAADRSTQIGFCTSTNADLNNNAGFSYMSVIMQQTVSTSPTYDVRQGTKPNGANTFFEGNAATATLLTVSNWYKLVATFVNSNDVRAGTFTVAGSLLDMGPNGTSPAGTPAMAFGPVTITNVDVTSARYLFFVLRGIENTGVDLWDNVSISTATGPIGFVQQPASQTAVQGQRVTFRALVDGDGPYSYQWSKNGTAIPGATGWKYVTPCVTPGDNAAQYTVAVTGPGNSITSDPAILTVTPEALAVVSAGSVDGTSVGVRFNQPVNVASAENPANYSINGTAPTHARVFRTSLSPLGPEGIYVVLTPATVLSGAFTVTVSGVTDIAGGAMGAANSAAGTVAGLTGIDVNPGATAPAGENHSFGPGQFHVMGGGADIFGVSDQFRYVYTQRTGDFDVKVKVPYLDVVRAPSKAGFDVRESLSPFSPHVLAALNPMWPARNQPEGVARATYNTATGSWGAAPTYSLSWYPNAWLRFRRTANTFIRYSSTNGVNWNCDGQVSGAIPATVYFGLAVCAVANNNECRAQFEEYGDFAGYSGATIAITAQPTNFTVAAGSSFTDGMRATITGAPAGGELSYIWQRNDGSGNWTNLLTAGATNNTVAIGPLFGSDNGAQFRCIVRAPGASDVTSDTFTATVTDAAVPTISSVNSAILPSYQVSEVVVNFSEPVSAATALDLVNFAVTNAAGVRLTVLSASFLHGDPRTVLLKVDGQFAGGSSTVRISGVRDLNNNLLATTVRTFRSFAPSTGPVVSEIYMDIGANGAIAGLTATNLFTNNQPTFIVYSNLFGYNVGLAGSTLSGLNFAAGTVAADNYGVRLSTYFVPPTNGNYKFWIRSDDSAQLFMNTNAIGSTNPAGRVLIAENAAFNGTYSVGSTPANSRTNIALIAGQPYYFELLGKEGSGGDGWSVMWTDPNVNTAPAATAFIPTANLAYPAASAPSTPVITEIYTAYPSFILDRANAVGLGLATNFPTGTYQGDVVNFKYIAGLPDYVAYQKYFATQPTLYNTRYDDYLGRMMTYFVAPSNGVYRFWMRSDDASQLYMNTNAVNSTDPAGKTLIGRLDVFTVGYNPVANGIQLTGGQRYYLEALWKEGGGGDGVAVAVRGQSDLGNPFIGPSGTAPSTGGPTEVIPASMLEYPLAVGRAGAVNMMGIAPVNPTVVDGRSLTLSAAGISGAAPYGGFIWLKNGVRVLDNAFTNITPPLTLADHGAVYTLIVTNPFSRIERSTTITVLPDGTAPTIVRTVGRRYNDGFSIQFSEPLDAASATYLANYQISGGLQIRSASLDQSRTIVSFETSPQTANTTYVVTINGVRDASSTGNLIAPNTSASFSTWTVGGSGFLVEMYTNIPGGAIVDLTSQPKFAANLPDVIYYTNVFGIGLFAGNSVLENYGARVSGYFSPSASGHFRFYLRSDDASQLYMNINSTDSENPAGRTLLVHVPGANLNIQSAVAASPPVQLNQGQRYYIEGLLKEGTGGDYLQVAFRQSDANGVLLGAVPVDNTVNENSTIFMFGGAGVPGDPNAITIQQAPPSELFVEESDSVTLELVASIPVSMARAVTYQWQKFDGLAYTNIPGARGPSLTFGAALEDDLRTVRLLFSAPGRVASYDTLLHVSPDNTGPRMVAAGSIDDGTHIGIVYSERIHPDDAIDTFLYEVNGGANVVFASEPRPDGKSVVLTVSPPVSGTFHIVATDVTDASAGAIDGTSEIDGKVYGFMPLDVGAPTAIGSSFSVRDGEIDVIAGGADVWGASDQGHLTLTPRYGDFDIWARIHSLSLSDAITKAGLMVRESTNAGSRVVHIQVNPPYLLGGRDLGEAAQRPNTGAATAIMPGFASYTPVGIPNAWVRMKREGNRFTAFRSDDGVNWLVAGATTLVMPDQVLIGLTTTAHNNAAPATLAEYRDVHIPNTPTILTQPAPGTQTVASHGSVTYSVVASNPPNSGLLTYQWRKDGLKLAGATSSSLTLSDLQSGQAGVYTVWVGNDGGATISAPATLIVGNEVPVVVADTVNTTVDVPVATPASTLLANDSDPENEPLSLFAVSGLYPVTYSSDFNSGLPAGASVFGTATAEATGGVGGSGSLRLNPSLTSQAGAFILNELTPRRRVAAFTASFKLRIAEGSAQPADGFSFNFGPDVTIGTAAAAENGAGTGLSFCVDNYQFATFPAGGTANTSGMKLRFGGGDITGVQTITWDKDAYIPVTVSLDVNGRVTVFVDGTNVFGNVTVPWTPRPGRFAFYGRTGGERQAHSIDDLSITTVLTIETERQASLNASIFGSAYIDGGFLHLNDAAGSVAGSFILNELTPGVPITSFTATFKLRIGNASAEPADGFSFNFANDLPIAASTPAAAENGGGTGFSFCVDNYRFAPYPGGGTANSSGMKIRLGGIDVAGVQMPTWNTTAFIPVSITLASDGALTVLVNGTNVFGNLILPITPSVGRFGLYGRTGGQLQTHWVDDLDIAVTTAGAPATYGANFNSGGFGTVVLNSGIVTYSPPAGACGTDAYYYLVSDASGAVSVGTVTVNIDPGTPQPPVITACAVPRTVQVGADCMLALPDLTSALIVNDCAAFVVQQSPAAGTLVGLGTTTVTLTVSNTFGLTASCQTTVTVIDTTPPQVVTCPAPVLLSADALCVATMPDLRPQFAAVDNCPITVSQNPAPGAVLALGLTSVTLTATDSNGNGTNCLTSVTVQDTTPPAIICPANQTAACTNSGGTVVNFSSTATDNCTAVVPVICTPASGSTFAIGVTTVNCVATDAANNSSTCAFTVTVSDSPQPAMTIVKQTGGVLIRWPQTCTPYNLEVTENLGGTPVWSPVTAPVVPVGTDNEVTISPADGNKFYRLIKQQ